jgi:glycosyltransferase involved in cell wall biosynthesis
VAETPTVSIVLPVWNGARYLADALQSIVEQTYRDFELIIVNDRSTDESPAIAERFVRADARVQLLHNTSQLKLPGSLNRGFSQARGKYLTWTSDDNVLHPTFLETLLAELERSGADLVYADFNSIDEDGNFLNVSPAGEAEDLVLGNSIGASFLYRRRVHDELGGYDVARFCYEDYDFWVRAYLAGFKFFRSTKIVYDYRRHPSSLTAQLKAPPPGYIDYVYGLRARFTALPPKTAFEARRILTGWGLALGLRRMVRLYGEALLIDPRATSALVAERARGARARLPSLLRTAARDAWARLR